MKLPIEVRSTRDAFIRKYPFPTKPDIKPNEVDAFEGEFRNWFGKLIQQLVYSHPNGNFGWKSNGVNSPPSKDFFAMNTHPVTGWDMFAGVGTGHPALNDDPDSQVIGEQNFISIVGVNYLDTPTPIPDPIPDPPVIPPVVEPNLNEKILEALNKIEVGQEAQTLRLIQGLSDIKDAVNKGIKVRF